MAEVSAKCLDSHVLFPRIPPLFLWDQFAFPSSFSPLLATCAGDILLGGEEVHQYVVWKTKLSLLLFAAVVEFRALSATHDDVFPLLFFPSLFDDLSKVTKH